MCEERGEEAFKEIFSDVRFINRVIKCCYVYLQAHMERQKICRGRVVGGNRHNRNFQFCYEFSNPN